MSIVKDAYGYLGELPISYLATSVDDQPYVRAMMLINKEEKFYYATDVTDGKVGQIKRNPKAEVCVLIGEGDGALRMRGLLEFVTNEDTRKEIHGCAGFIQGFWSNPQDPAFVLMEFKPNYLELMRPGSTKIERVEI